MFHMIYDLRNGLLELFMFIGHMILFVRLFNCNLICMATFVASYPCLTYFLLIHFFLPPF